MNQTANFDEKNITSFFGNVPKPMELTYVGLCLGAPMQYRTDKNTGLDEVCMLVPKTQGIQPVMVTLGKEESVANGMRSAIYHSCGIDKLLNGEGNTCKLLAEKFAATTSMGPNNDYISKIYEPKASELREKLLRQYPENIKDFDNAVEQYKIHFANVFASSNKKADDEKKNGQQMMS